MDEATSALIGLRELSSRARFIVVDKHTFDRRGCLEAPLEAERGCRMTMSTSYPSAVSMRSGRSKEFSRKSPRGNRDTSGWHKPSSRAAMPYLKDLQNPWRRVQKAAGRWGLMRNRQLEHRRQPPLPLGFKLVHSWRPLEDSSQRQCEGKIPFSVEGPDISSER